jgi:hypothetical protein
LLEERIDGEIEVDAAGVTGDAGVKAAKQAKQRQIGAACLQVPERDIERGKREHHRAATPAIMQAPPGVMPDGFGVVGFAAFDQLGNFPPESVGNRAAVAADGVGVADALGPVGIAEAACHEFKGRDFAMRAVGEGNRQRDPVESGLDCLDKCHCFHPVFS